MLPFSKMMFVAKLFFVILVIINGASTEDSLNVITSKSQQSVEKNVAVRSLFYDEEISYSFVIFGASGDLATKKLYPSLWLLFRDNLLPKKTHFYGFARNSLTVPELRKLCEPYTKVKPEEEARYNKFWELNYYMAGDVKTQADFQKLNTEITKKELNADASRMFYFALPPKIFGITAKHVQSYCLPARGWTKVVVEKPFGRDSSSSRELSDQLKQLFNEEQVYRIDHYLGKEMVQNLMSLRFGNRIFDSTWNSQNIASVQIILTESIGTQGRGGYFDPYGIIRDVIQNHMIQILSLIAMEKPASLQPKDIRDEKVNVLKYINPLQLHEVVLGQYIGDPNSKDPEAREGYLDEEWVPNNSTTPTFAVAVFRINNERWSGIPFIFKCGKALTERKTEIRIQYRNVEGDIFKGKAKQNELVIRVQPGEAIHVKMMVKTPGISFEIEETELDLTYAQRYNGVKIPDAYERLILDIFSGSQALFVRDDELKEAWRILTPVLQRIEKDNVHPIPYKYNSRGPPEADKLAKRYGVILN